MQQLYEKEPPIAIKQLSESELEDIQLYGLSSWRIGLFLEQQPSFPTCMSSAIQTLLGNAKSQRIRLPDFYCR